MARYNSLEEAAAALSRLTGPVLRQALTTAVRGVTTVAFVGNVTRSPVGRPQAATVNGIRFPGDPHPGKLRSSWRTSLGKPAYARLPDAAVYPVPGAGQVAAALKNYKVGQDVFVSNDARTDRAKRGYADVVALVGRHIDRRGREIGSLQAPRGTVLPTMEEVSRKAPGIILDAINQAVDAGGL